MPAFTRVYAPEDYRKLYHKRDGLRVPAAARNEPRISDHFDPVVKSRNQKKVCSDREKQAASCAGRCLAASQVGTDSVAFFGSAQAKTN